MNAFQPYASLEHYIGRRLLMLLAALALADIAILLSVSLSTILAGMGDGTVLTRTMRAMHNMFPTIPFLIVGKKISLEDVRLSIEKMVAASTSIPTPYSWRPISIITRS